MAKARSDKDVASSLKKPSLVFMVLLSLCTSVEAETNAAVEVIRRISNDWYRLNSGVKHSICDRTYLVNEMQCVSDKELFNGKYIMNNHVDGDVFCIHRMQLSSHSYKTLNISHIYCISL